MEKSICINTYRELDIQAIEFSIWCPNKWFNIVAATQHQASAVERVEWVLSWEIILINDILYCYDYYLYYEMLVNIYLSF